MTPILLGTMASVLGGRYRGRIVAVFLDHQAALKWGSWEEEYVPPPGARDLGQRHALIHVPGVGAVLVGGRDLCYKAPEPADGSPVIDPGMVRSQEPWHPPAQPGRKPRSAIRRRKPVIGIGG